MSVYNDKIASDITIVKSVAKLRVAFPKMTSDFFDLLSEMIVESDMTEQQLKDAVKNVLCNFQYKELTISNILSFDKKVKIYTYSEACSMVTKGELSMDDFQIRNINGICYRLKKSDIDWLYTYF